jgi:diguanylate cyclase (GGDEF)-like protein
MMPSAERLAGSAIAFAALTIVALAGLALVELDRETALHRETIASLQVKDSLEALREELIQLEHAARIVALNGAADAQQEIERRVVEIDAELDYLGQNPAREAKPVYSELVRASQRLGTSARLVVAGRKLRNDAGVEAAATQVRAAAVEARSALERTLEAQSAGINDRMLAQLRVSETLKTYVAWLLAGSAVVLVGLLGFYRWAKLRERAAAQHIEHLAHYDTLTGLPNRVLLTDLLAREVARAQRSERGFALLMLDLDGFKEVNDTWGHGAGDEVLAMVAERAQRSVRAADVVGRLGGDEFLAILPEATNEGALQVAEKLRASLSEPYLLTRGNATLGASVGVSYFGEHGTDAEALLRRADEALYEAKRRGKDRVLEAEPAT